VAEAHFAYPPTQSGVAYDVHVRMGSPASRRTFPHGILRRSAIYVLGGVTGGLVFLITAWAVTHPDGAWLLGIILLACVPLAMSGYNWYSREKRPQRAAKKSSITTAEAAQLAQHLRSFRGESQLLDEQVRRLAEGRDRIPGGAERKQQNDI
jgi:hypothetical protein